MAQYYNPFSLDDKTILITGASSGIGRATAIECSKMGAKLIISGRNENRLTETAKLMKNGNHNLFSVDLNDEEKLTDFVKELPSLDGLVLCAGINETIPTQFASRKKFDKIFNINFFSTVELIRQIQKAKKINTHGSVVIISSIGGNYSIDIGNGVYGASKAALSSWSKFLAIELAVKKIRVNSICPGIVQTPLSEAAAITEEQLAINEAKYPLKRFASPEEIAYACVYFLSDASSWVTGTNFIIDGGITI